MNKMAPASKRLLFYPHLCLRELLRWEHHVPMYVLIYIHVVYNDPFDGIGGKRSILYAWHTKCCSLAR